MPFRKIKLYGKLGKLFGKEWILDVNTVGEALRAIDINTNGEFQKYLYNGPGAKIHYKVCVKNKKNTLTKEEINTPYEKGDIYIIPVLKGTGKNGILTTILGVVLVVVGLVINYITFGSGSPVGGYFIKTGIALALGGIAQMLSPNPNTNEVERKSSYLFQGNALTANQGTAVGTIYGRAIVNPMPICVSMDNVDENTYEGKIAYVGAIGLINESLILYSYRGGNAALIGYSEFIDPSTPPKKYRIRTNSGAVTSEYNTGSPQYLPCYWTYSYGGANIFDKNTGTCSGNRYRTCNGSGPGIGIGGGCLSSPVDPPTDSSDCSGEEWRTFLGDTQTITPTVITKSHLNLSGSGQVTLSDEDTESDAINRLLNSISWSAWQSSPVYPFYYRNPSGFNIYYQTVKTKSITLPDKYNPGLQYKYSAVVQRRAYGSSDPWIDAEIISTIVTPQSNGTLILPELEIPNESGYESKIVSPSLSY